MYCDAYGDKANESLEAQKQTILNYCKYKGINCDKIFENTREDVSIDPNGDQDLELGEEYKEKLTDIENNSNLDVRTVSQLKEDMAADFYAGVCQLSRDTGVQATDVRQNALADANQAVKDNAKTHEKPPGSYDKSYYKKIDCL